MINGDNPNMSEVFMPYHIIIYAKLINYTQKKVRIFSQKS